MKWINGSVVAPLHVKLTLVHVSVMSKRSFFTYQSELGSQSENRSPAPVNLKMNKGTDVIQRWQAAAANWDTHEYLMKINSQTFM